MDGLFGKQKAAAFFQKANNYLLDVCWTAEEASEATASNVASQISSLRDDTGQKCVNEDEEADAEAHADDLASEVETDRTRQKIRRDLAKFRRRLQERVQLLLSQKN